MQKTILIIGTADTKSDELQFMQSCIQEQGGSADIMDVGILDHARCEVKYSRHDVAAAAGTTNEAIIALGDENLAMTKTAEGASKLCLQLTQENKIDGVLLLGGTMGTDLALEVASFLPFGFPKMIVSTISFSHLIPPERLSPDLMMILWSGGLYGLNALSKSGLQQACGAILGAARSAQKIKQDRPVIGMSSLGKSALKYMVALKDELDKRGFEISVFHTTGQGGRALECLSEKKHFAAVMDFSLQEVVNEMKGSIVTSGKNRLETAGKNGIPQIIAPGAIDLIDVATWKELPADYKNRPIHIHNRLIASVTMSPDERREAARLISKKLSAATAPVVFILPLQGVEEWDRNGNPLHDPEGLQAFNDEIRSVLNKPVELIEVDAHINDKAFTDKVLEVFDSMVQKGIIKKEITV